MIISSDYSDYSDYSVLFQQLNSSCFEKRSDYSDYKQTKVVAIVAPRLFPTTL